MAPLECWNLEADITADAEGTLWPIVFIFSFLVSLASKADARNSLWGGNDEESARDVWDSKFEGSDEDLVRDRLVLLLVSPFWLIAAVKPGRHGTTPENVGLAFMARLNATLCCAPRFAKPGGIFWIGAGTDTFCWDPVDRFV